MANNQSVNKQSQLHGPAASLTTLYNNIDSVLPPPATINLNGTNYNNVQLKQLVMGYLGPYQNVTSLKSQLGAGYAARNAKVDAVKQFLSIVQLAAGNQFGVGSSPYLALGFKVKKAAAPLTSEQQVVKHQKQLATRAARGTGGPRQKAAVVGTVSFPVTVDANGQAAPASPAAQAQAPATPVVPAAPQNGTVPSSPPVSSK